MAESTPISVVYGTRGGGGVYRSSQISGTDANNRQYRNQLGQRVWGLDANGYYGSWVWCLAGGALTAGESLGLIDNTSTPPTSATQFKITQCVSAAVTTMGTTVAGIVETTAASGEYVWLRTHGYYPTLLTASHTAVANETSYIGPISGGTNGIATAVAATHTLRNAPFATCVADGSTVTSGPVYLHCYLLP